MLSLSDNFFVVHVLDSGTLPQKIELSACCQQIELLQHVIYSKHVNWLKNIEILELPLVANYIPQNSATEHSISSNYRLITQQIKDID